MFANFKLVNAVVLEFFEYLIRLRWGNVHFGHTGHDRIVEWCRSDVCTTSVEQSSFVARGGTTSKWIVTCRTSAYLDIVFDCAREVPLKHLCTGCRVKEASSTPYHLLYNHVICFRVAHFKTIVKYQKRAMPGVVHLSMEVVSTNPINAGVCAIRRYLCGWCYCHVSFLE